MGTQLSETIRQLKLKHHEHQHEAEHLMLAINELLQWMHDKELYGELPCNCRMYPSKKFVRTEGRGDGTRKLWTLTLGEKHSIDHLLVFSELIEAGFLIKLDKMLQQEVRKFQSANKLIATFVSKEK